MRTTVEAVEAKPGRQHYLFVKKKKRNFFSLEKVKYPNMIVGTLRTM